MQLSSTTDFKWDCVLLRISLTHWRSTLSLNWIKIIDNSGAWFLLFVAKPPRRITLFYICNEIVQTCKRKRATPYKESFQLVLPEATALVRLVLQGLCELISYYSITQMCPVCLVNWWQANMLFIRPWHEVLKLHPNWVQFYRFGCVGCGFELVKALT